MKTFLTSICFAGSLALVVGCQSTQSATSVAAIGTALTAADTLAVEYVTLPLCSAGTSVSVNGSLCSQATVSAEIKAAAQAVYTAYKAYEANPSTAAALAANQALAALTALVPATAASVSK